MSLLLAALSFLAPGHAADLGVRDLRGAPVVTRGPAVVVFWSMDCEVCVRELHARSERSAEVVAVNTDPVQDHARLLPFLRSQGVSVTVVADPAGELRRRYNVADAGAILVLGADGHVAERSTAGSGSERLTATAARE